MALPIRLRKLPQASCATPVPAIAPSAQPTHHSQLRVFTYWVAREMRTPCFQGQVGSPGELARLAMREAAWAAVQHPPHAVHATAPFAPAQAPTAPQVISPTLLLELHPSEEDTADSDRVQRKREEVRPAAHYHARTTPFH